MADELSKRQRHNILRAQLLNDVSSFIPHWRECNDYILPRRGRFFVTDVNRGERRNQKIIDGTATYSARTLRSGMMSGITSPARPWFRLITPDPDLNEYAKVKEWMEVCTQRMQTVFLRSNQYQTSPIVYGDIGVFGTAAELMEEDFQNTLRCYAFPIGSYRISNNESGKVDVFQRDFRMSVRNIVKKFGAYDGKTGKPNWDQFSSFVRSAYERGQYETMVDVCQIIEPNDEHDPVMLDAKFKKYASSYWEPGTGGGQSGNYLNSDNDRRVYLKESGYDYFPVLCPRWEVTGEDSYGTACPGMDALGDIKQLQTGERRGAQAIDKMINPPMVGPTSMKTTKSSILPGDMTYNDEREGTKGFRPAHEVNFRIDALENKQAQVRQRVQKAFYEDLFLMLAESDRREITATEVAERKEEKLLALGPVLEQLNQDYLDPKIDITFDLMLRQGQIPPPPPEIQGMKLHVEYLSVMAQAQKLITIGGVERFSGFLSQVAAVAPEAMDKVNVDKMVEVYGDITSIPPGIVRTDDEVQALRQQRQQAQQRQQQVEQIQQSAGAARDLSQADMSGDNALTRLMDTAKAGQIVPNQ